jgi:carbamoyltransferase
MPDKKYLLGLNYIGHDASASLFNAGELIASAPEERFTRQKKDRSFPENAIEFCINRAGINIDDLDVITYYLDPERHFEERVIHHLGRYYPESVPLFDENLNRAQKVSGVDYEIRDRLDYHGEIYFCTHHLAHIASSFYPSGFEDCVAVSVDGLGEITSTVVADVEKGDFEILKEINFPHSLGLLYAAVTHYLGFNATTDAGKVMGLASYGDYDRYIKDFRDIVPLINDGGYELDLEYFEFPFQRDLWISDSFLDRFGPKRDDGEELTERHENLAAALQKRVEEVLFHLVEWGKTETGKNHLCLSGGVALNSVANGKIRQANLFEEIYVPPPAGDDGTSVGGPLYYHHNVKGNTDRQPITPYTGRGYDGEQIIAALDRFNLKYRKSDAVCAETAEFLANGDVVGWFQGRGEMGPRALGNRSILTDPTNKRAKQILNARVKFREPFRPFAPSVLEEAVGEWFTCGDPAPYMLHVYDVIPEKRAEIPGVTHVDGTARLQTVSREDNERYHRLISEFESHSGVPMVVNTSFNIKGEPIVNRPTEAIRCFLGNGIDYLVMGDYIVDKESLWTSVHGE